MYIKEKKEINKGVRITNTVNKFVEGQEGKGFNEKLENMVLYCMKKLPDIEAQIKEREKYLKELETKITEKKNLLNDLDSIGWNLKSVERDIKQILNKTEKITEENKKQLKAQLMSDCIQEDPQEE